MDITTKIASENPPCDKACAMRSHCHSKNDSCAQFKEWERTQKIDIEKSRVPKQLETVKDIRKKRVYKHAHQDPKLIARQMKIKHWLGAMNQQQLVTVGKLVGMDTESLIEKRSPAAGLTQIFMGRMHKRAVLKYLHEQGIAQKVAA
jgi:hypothetical protein